MALREFRVVVTARDQQMVAWWLQQVALRLVIGEMAEEGEFIEGGEHGVVAYQWASDEEAQ